ncbi:MAG: nucleotide sugar dehydrogenase [Synergistaceae bacterium]|jgi:UDP-N-acetyl-D-mannosaminuronic acid dehydrogenase|nr:nucleotide sugar dehydrogenase [Synergistaceae bacterium]
MVNVIGLGYIGLPTALMLAAHGVEVVGTDCDVNRISELNAGRIFFNEPGLKELFTSAVSKGIQFTSEYVRANTYIIAVPTPCDSKSKKINLSIIAAAIEYISAFCPKGAILIIESTVSPGSIEKLARSILDMKGFTVGEDIHLAHAPERVIPGNMIQELKHNPRTIGADNPAIAKSVADLYRSFCESEITLTNIRTAEMTKVAENTFRDVNIAFANELAKICRNDNINVYDVISIANKHPRVNILFPGPGVGGHCIAVDPWFLVGDYFKLANLVFAARKVNDSMPEYVLERIATIMKAEKMEDISRVGLYGLTYKADVDDVRESPTLQLLECMERHLAHGVKVYDPLIKQDMVKNQYHNLDVFLGDVDMVVIMVGHKEVIENLFKLENKILLDTHNIASALRHYSL